MNFLELANKRESVRKYINKKIERTEIEKCIEAARIAPSACNSQPWSFIVVDDEEKLSEVAKASYTSILKFNKFSESAAAIVVIVMEPGKFKPMLATPFTNLDYAFIDMGIACEHFCLQAAELNIGSCIMGYYQKNKIKEILNIPKSKKIGLLISLGYHDNFTARPKARKNIETILEYNKYCKK